MQNQDVRLLSQQTSDFLQKDFGATPPASALFADYAGQASKTHPIQLDKITIEQNFTANKTDLNDSLDNMYPEGGQTAVIDAVYLAAEKVTEYEKERGKEDRKRRALRAEARSPPACADRRSRGGRAAPGARGRSR